MLFASSAIIYFFLTMGSTESIEDFVISPHSLDHVSIKSACSGLELRSYCSSVELELNKENEQHQEESPSQLKKSVHTSSQVEESLSECEKPHNINVVPEKRCTISLSAKKYALPSDGEKISATGDKGIKADCEKRFKRKLSKGIQDKREQRVKRKLSCVSSSQPICGNDFHSVKVKNWEIEHKKQLQIAKKMKLKADRATEKLELVRSELKKVYDILMK